LQDTDILEAIEGKSTREMSLAEIRALLVGEPGSNLNLSVVRARKAEPQKVVVTRDVVNIPAPQEKMLQDGVGEVHVDALTKGKSQEVGNKIKSLQRSGAKKLILDLRDCAEGEESEGIATANLFLNHGTITYLQGQKYPREAFNADPSKAVTTLPLVVLVNKGTAGPAEIVAAAVLENARGDVIGDIRVHLPDVLLGHRHELRKAPISIDAENVHLLADVHLPGAARLTDPATDVAFGADALADLRALHAAAHRDHLADELVAGRGTNSDTAGAPLVPLVNVPVCAADAGVGDGDQDIARGGDVPGRGLRRRVPPRRLPAAALPAPASCP